jgi:hypothetical protein
MMAPLSKLKRSRLPSITSTAKACLSLAASPCFKIIQYVETVVVDDYTVTVKFGCFVSAVPA